MELLKQAHPLAVERPTPTDPVGRNIRTPFRFRTEEHVRVPFDPVLDSFTASELRHVLVEPATRDLPLVPIERYPPVVEKLPGIDASAGPLVAVDHLEENRVHAQLDLRMRVEDLFLHPPGAVDAGASGGRKEEHEPRLSSVGVEPCSQVLDRIEVDPRARLAGDDSGKYKKSDETAKKRHNDYRTTTNGFAGSWFSRRRDESR